MDSEENLRKLHEPKFRYDKRGDVMHIYLEYATTLNYHEDEPMNGVILRRADDDNRLIKITILDYVRRLPERYTY